MPRATPRETRTQTRRVGLAVATVLGFGAPVLLYFWFLHCYSVNVVSADQWDNVTLIAHLYNGTLGMSNLWSLHNENRMLFPNLLVLALTPTTHFNLVFEEYLGGVMLVASTGLIIVAHKRWSGRPWIYYCPVAILMLSLVQYGNTLWGFEIAWYLVLLCFALVIYWFSRPALTWFVLAVAIVAAVVGSFSSLQGLLIWPAGLVLLYHRYRSRPFVIAWLGSAVATATVYFSSYHDAYAPSPLYAVEHPVVALEFYVYAIGDVLGVQTGVKSTPNAGVVIFGVVVIALALVVVVLYGIRRDEHNEGAPIGIALLCFALLFAGTVTDGRIRFLNISGYPWAAAGSRYRTYDLLVLVGIYLAVLGRPTRHFVNEQRALLAVRAALIVAMCLQVGVGIGTGLRGGRSVYQQRVLDARVVANIDGASSTEIGAYVAPFQSKRAIELLVGVLAEHHLSLFDGDSARYAHEGLP
jgi:hypothetical protein